ncbi:gamma-glutamyl-gamma-aminobutyrate hydrolase family protein [Schaalia sp. ZJ405]|uniref:anthranilate synthase component II n=1 Tax=unclassified Schaalia TaxID=2691889 RepID=UPI0013EC4895|nr:MULTISPECIES: gamma-glutamyl-gamma-aminobutyrate hydrolase family protein [unclassified Schaalia]QPK81431.1 gamma-glutamyl-gamma-aminobutyrate hydrolase family protein [Schaalia sp. ZJ405]
MTRILCIDNYDSFVWTIVGYLRHLGAQVDVVRNDAVDPRWYESETYDGVLISPGPGDPQGAGQSLRVIGDCVDHRIPMLGVCLGHQALGEFFGATVTHAPELMHGKTSVIHHDGRGVFTGIDNPVTVTRYHSLAVDPSTLPDVLETSASTDGGIIMGLRHRDLPLWGVQFHPESVMTQQGHRMLANWLELTGDDGAVARSQLLHPVVAQRSEL